MRHDGTSLAEYFLSPEARFARMIRIAIIPILFQSGTAVLPTVFAGLGSVLAIFIKPSEWLRSSPRQRAAFVILIFGAIASAWGLTTLARIWHERHRRDTDWSQVALNIIQQQQLRASEGAAERLQPLWQFKQPNTSFLSTPVVRDGRVYAASCRFDVTGSMGSILCLDAATGQLLWQVETINRKSLR